MKTLYQFLEQVEPAQEPKKEDPKVKQAQAKENMLKKRVLAAKMRAVRGGATGIMASHEPEGEVIEGVMTMLGKKKKEKKAEKAMDAGARAKRKLARKVHAKYVSGSEDNVPDDIREGDVHSGQGEKIQKRTKKWMDKKGQKGAPGLDAMKARTAEHKAKRGVKEGTDKAFEYVKKQIAAKYGKSGYVSKDNPRRPQTAAEKAKVRAHQAKVDKDNAAERAKDPSQGRYPKG